MSALRVMVLDVWDEVTIPFDPGLTVQEVKRLALEQARVGDAPSAFEVKHRGARVLDESAPLAMAGVGPGAALIVLRARRRAVR